MTLTTRRILRGELRMYLRIARASMVRSRFLVSGFGFVKNKTQNMQRAYFLARGKRTMLATGPEAGPPGRR